MVDISDIADLTKLSISDKKVSKCYVVHYYVKDEPKWPFEPSWPFLPPICKMQYFSTKDAALAFKSTIASKSRYPQTIQEVEIVTIEGVAYTLTKIVIDDQHEFDTIKHLVV